ncbi:MAG: TonB family protein [Kofleriaceae bacterium]
MPSTRRHKRVSQATKWFAVAGTLVVHLVVMAVWELRYLGWIGDGVAVVAASEPQSEIDEDIELQTSCTGDVLLATTARAAMCLAPWRANAAECADELEVNMYMDLSGCRTKPDENYAQVAMVTPKAAEKLEAIDPEQLVEEFKQQEQQKPPPPQPVPPPQPQAATPPPPPQPPAPTKPSQVVETVKPNTEAEPPDARFLSEHNIKVEKQKVARGATKEPMVAKSKPEELVAKKDPPKEEPAIKEQPDKPPGQNEKAPTQPGKLSMRKPGAVSPQETPQEARTRGSTGGPKDKVVSDGFIPRKGDGAIEQLKRDPGELTKGQGGAGGGTPPVPNLKPNKEQLERALGGGSVDHLEDVDNGDETALSSKRWVYASFFNRLKRQVAQNWDPQTVWRRSDPNGTKHGFKSRITEVRVSLAPNGQMSKISVIGPSGVGELDEEAVRAFHAAAPFPNPPDGLVKDKLITFAFSFHFEIGQPRASWKVIRSQ